MRAKQIHLVREQKLSMLLFLVLGEYFMDVCVLVMIVNTCLNANLIALVFPLSAFLYGMIEYPVQSRGYWNFLLWFVVVELSCKFLYQMPVFCDSPPYTIVGFTSGTCEARVPTLME
jgi:hypothetical protein